MMKLKKNIPVVLLVIVIVAVLGVLVFYPKNRSSAELDVFAGCLAEKNVVMYGAYWCPHCQNEKKRFGDSFRLVPYVECTEETEKCITEKINGYPTWIFPDGHRFEGEMGLERLSAKSGCPLPQ
jgi:hypothetical protein